MSEEPEKRNDSGQEEPQSAHKILVEADTLTPEPQAIQFAARMAGVLHAKLFGSYFNLE